MRQSLIWSWTLCVAVGCTCSRTVDIEEASERARLERLPREQGGFVDAAVIPNARSKDTKPKVRMGKRCQTGTAQQTVSAVGSVAGHDELDPFGVEVGAPLVEAQGFWVPWLSSDGKTSTVGINEVGRDLLTSRSVALGQVHWDGGPPRLARLSADTLVAVVPDGDANGGSYRIAVVSPRGVAWGEELDGSSDDSPAFDLAATAGKVLLVWDDYDRERGIGTIRGTLLGAEGAVVKKMSRISPETTDAEGPRLARHKNGYWLAWLRVAWQPKENAIKNLAQSGGDPGVDEAVVEAKQRWIEVLPLDTDGNPTGVPQRVSDMDAMVQGYDIQSGHDGGLVLSWRQDFANAGTNGGELWTAHLSAGGALETFPVEASAVGGTLPVLLFDPMPPSGVPHGWLSVEAASGESALLALSPFGKPLEELSSNVGLGVASVLGALDGQLLLARPKRRDVVLQLTRCAYNPHAGPDAGAPSP